MSDISGTDTDFLVPPALLERILAVVGQPDVEFGEVFVEDVRTEGITLDDGRVENLATSRDRGAGIRVIVGGKTGFAHTSDLTEHGLLSAAEAALAAAVVGASDEAPSDETASDETAGTEAAGTEDSSAPVLTPQEVAPAPVAVRPETVETDAKLSLLRRADAAARAVDDAITQVSVSYADSRRRILVANTDGLLSTDDQTRTRFAVNCVATGDAGLQTGYESIGNTVGFELFDTVDVERAAHDAAERAITKLSAVPAPSGTHTVVIGPGSGGVLFHEACGHGLEADLVAKGASVFAGRLGQPVASPLVTLIDDGTMAGEWGQIAIDDEGRPAARNVLIENGILVDYLRDGTRARAEGKPSSGNGRRQSYRHLPMVRMTNTYLAAGDSDPADIIAGVDYGVYVARLGGGQVDTGSGDFVFGMTEAYLIEEGKITTPIREGQLIGNGPKVLQLIDAVGNDFDMGGPGTCGKDGQGVPVGDGVPTLRVTEMTIGGTAA